MAKLVVISDEFKGQTFELNQDKITVGRTEENTIQLKSSAVSSHHAELLKKGEDYFVRDLNSTNGTRVNGQRVVEMRLGHGDIVGFGQIQMEFSSGKGAPQPLPAVSRKPFDFSKSSPVSTARPVTYQSSSPFSKHERGRSKVFLQIACIVLGLAVVGLLVYALYILTTTT